ncbi:NAD-dependent succinate-semialdehyde dehydrogenase [Novosphingobium sp. M1R2S20]|uniref:NAD-dependent succinate-semialdehyde dehydrogenase n=1 Tax=Novosphingobium rhizovicinum TaxID=3228928 RepID=A0ABV3RC09_9SPHN
MLIDGEWRKTAEETPVTNPADETLLRAVPVAASNDIDAAIAAAERGQRVWQKTAPAERARVILAAAALLRERAEDIALASTLEQGKPLAQSQAEVLRACEIIEWDANEGRRLYGRTIPAESGLRHTVLREPIGIVAAFSPWNFPVSPPARKIAGALSAGCAIILKPSEETPAGAIQLAHAFLDAGLPAGVLNILFGDPAHISQRLIAHRSVRLVTFTGSVPVGKRLAALAGEHMKPAIMELGGHSPVIVCADAPVIETARASVQIKARNAGQVCVAPTRFFAHASLYEAFVEEAAARAAELAPLDGRDPACRLGPLANARRLAAVDALVKDAVSRGARLLAGGRQVERRSFYYPLTVLADLPANARAMHEEPFGPLMLIQPFTDLDDAIARANSLPFGLAAYAFTDSAQAAERISSEVQCGNLSINHYVASLAETPFGGIKDSGYGREGGMEGLHCYTTVKNVSHRLRPSS